MALCTEVFGDRAQPAMLLIMGSAASMDWWEDEFCERLASGGRFVIRYDHQDTGQSTSYPASQPGYALHDLLLDAVGVLDAHRIETVHLVGMSMGGAIAQLLALEHAGRVASLTLISASPGDEMADPWRDRLAELRVPTLVIHGTKDPVVAAILQHSAAPAS